MVDGDHLKLVIIKWASSIFGGDQLEMVTIGHKQKEEISIDCMLSSLQVGKPSCVSDLI